MLKRLSHKTIEDPIPNYILNIDHNCSVSKSGHAIQDKIGNFYSYSKEISQSFSGFSNFDMAIEGNAFDLSSFSLFFLLRSFSDAECSPLIFGNGLWLNIKNGLVTFKSNLRTFFSSSLDHYSKLGYDLTFGMVKNQNGISFMVNGKNIEISGLNIGSGIGMTFSVGVESYIDHMLLYEQELNEQEMRRLSSSFISLNSMLDGFGYLPTDQMIKMG